MTPGRQEDLFDPEGHYVEGLFDDQLPLPLPSLEMPLPFQSIVKRDGREESFSTNKIAMAILRAGQSVGEGDFQHAASLASAVTIYLKKHCLASAPTVDQVHDAVERVLMHMSQVETALAYARYRDRRARIRRLREGDLRALLGELEEARRERESLGGHAEGALLVRTSADTLVTWDRDRIVSALIRETDLDRNTAFMIALEVEQQIEQAQIKTLTSSLVRELVSAKLTEHGLEAYREKHQRLGVPLYDTERILRGSSPESAGSDPVGTDRALAHAVKKEYALARLFPAEVAEAHLRGEIHLHQMGLLDRFSCVNLSLLPIVRMGAGLPGRQFVAAPPADAEGLLSQMLFSATLYDRYFAEPPSWRAVNVLFAPFLQGMDAAALDRFAALLIYEFAYRTLAQGAAMPPPELELCYAVPGEWREIEALGPEGEGLGKPYSAFSHTAQRFARALLTVLGEGGRDGAGFSAPRFVLRLDKAFFQEPGNEAFLTQATAVAARRREIPFSLIRNGLDSSAAGQPQALTVHQVTLNLPRAALDAVNEDALWPKLEGLLALAASAHLEKRNFMEGLIDATGHGPLSALASRQGKNAGFDLHGGWYLVALEGLNECVQALTGAALHENDEAMALGQRILAFLRERCVEITARLGIHLVLAPNSAVEVSERFAMLDAAAFPKAAGLPKMDERTQSLRYSTGVRLPTAHRLSPIEVARLEGQFHALLDTGCQTEAPLPLANTSESTLADFLKKAYHQTENRRIEFV